ncbi:MAG TPA: hypothetical protein VHS99_03975 [Chloroflexota bacterium]|jgi:hypothetical protein|nr:hypothetical protein [Chloroflexota bacterium]
MAKTMVANITGTRLRETERQLALLKGEAAVSAFLDAHPHETKVLQQLVDRRRSGQPAPPLSRVQRAMVWSDGTIEFTTLPGAAPAAAPGAEAPRGRRPPARGGRGERVAGGLGSPRPASSVGGGGRAREPWRGAPSPGAGTSGSAPGRPRRGRPSQRPAGEFEEARGLPRSGEGWALLRSGERPPSETPEVPAPDEGGLTTPERQEPEPETPGTPDTGQPEGAPGAR